MHAQKNTHSSKTIETSMRPAASAEYQRALEYLASKRLQLDFLTSDAGMGGDQSRFFLNQVAGNQWRLEGIVELPSWTLTATGQSADPFHVVDQVFQQLQRQLLQQTGSYRRLLDCQVALNSTRRDSDYLLVAV